MNKIFLSADAHFGHENVIKYCNRPFKDANHMNEILIQNWNSIVEESDLVFYLGDFSLQGCQAVESYFKRLNGKKHLISGNHDKSFKYKYVLKYLNMGWCSVSRAMQWDINGRTINLCHFPYKGGGDSGYQERYPEYRLEDNGNVLLMGHVHDAFKMQRTKKGTLMINVGVDVWDYAPVLLDTLLELM